jgi:antitoxin HicB
MLRYPVELIADAKNGGFQAGFLDFPFVHSVGDTEEEALREAANGLESGIEFFFDEHRPVPLPSRVRRGQHIVALPALVASKVFLHNEMLRQGVKKAELARRMDIAPPNIERIFKVRYKTRIETVEAALSCLGKHLDVRLTMG